MNRRCTAVVIASVLSLATLLGLAWAANVEEELKKLETDRAAARLLKAMWQRSKSKRPTTTRSSTCTAKCRTSHKW